MSLGRCLILGGSGFIGSHLAELLVAEDFEVRILSRSAGSSSRLVAVAARVELLEGDYRDTQRLANAIRGCDYVYHLIATTVPAISNRDVVSDTDTNLIPTLRLLEICARENVRRIVFCSSGGTVYGRTENRPITEIHSTEPLSSYGIVKLTIEKYLELFRFQHGLDYNVLRVSNCYGPRLPIGGEQGVVGAFLERLRRKEPIVLWGDGSITRDYVYVSDVARAFRVALKEELSFRVFNIGTGVGTSLLALIEMMERVTGCRARICKEKARQIDVGVNILDSTLAQQYLGWEATTALEEGLLNTWNWIQTRPRTISAGTP